MRGKPRLDKIRDKGGNLLSENWYIFYFERGHTRRVSTGYRIGKEDHAANLALAQFTLERERPLSREPHQLMIAQALKDYYNEHALHTATAKHMQYHEKRLLAHFGERMVGDITQGKINDYIRTRQAAGESNGTVRRDLEVLKAALNHEEREKRLTYAPKFKMPEAPAPRGRTLTDKEAKTLKAACKSEHVKNFIILMLETGQRPGAIEQLMWHQVDFKQQIIHFDRTGKRQTNKRVRAVPMSEEVIVLLRRLFKAKKTLYVLEYLDPITKTIKPAGCVKKAFQRACEAAGIDAYRYALRKTFANRDMDELTRMAFMGHTTVKTSREHYIMTNIPKMREALKKPKNSPRRKS